MRAKLMPCLVFVSCILSIWTSIYLYKQLNGVILRQDFNATELSWIFQLVLNLLTYSTVLLPFYIVYKYLDKTNYFDKISTPTLTSRILLRCFGPGTARLEPARTEAVSSVLELCHSVVGLLGAYLVWGLLQERIMTQVYDLDGHSRRFSDSQFLVFVNRLCALTVATVRLGVSVTSVGVGVGGAPLYTYSYCSVSNVLAAWCQYEALKYVSFPTQVLSKSCKVVCVLATSRLVSRRSHPVHDWVAATLVACGMVLALMGQEHISEVTTMSGLCLLLLYLACDSFTATWQGELFTLYRVTPVQMMFGVNLFSVLLTGLSILQNPLTASSLVLLQNPLFVLDVLILSASSTIGQLLIYSTIAKFGPVVFTIIMTLRQAISIVLSCIIYEHYMSPSGIFGIFLVFFAVGLRIYCRQRIASKIKRIEV